MFSARLQNLFFAGTSCRARARDPLESPTPANAESPTSGGPTYARAQARLRYEVRDVIADIDHKVVANAKRNGYPHEEIANGRRSYPENSNGHGRSVDGSEVDIAAEGLQGGKDEDPKVDFDKLPYLDAVVHVRRCGCTR